ncbi:unnamed protein product [Ilex paraguariensis]|uniref:Uncharacterized protein n=1 Tax=Ilex paraguariensis TaxID=185542 RepID=A0ABC8U172_9AQUA
MGVQCRTILSFVFRSKFGDEIHMLGLEGVNAFILDVNLRRKSSSPLLESSIGNIIWMVIAHCKVNSNLGLPSTVGHLKNSIVEINKDFVEEIKGDEGSLKVGEHLKEMAQLYSNPDADYFLVTSWCNFGLHDTNFGWGKPKWWCISTLSTNTPVLSNVIFLVDTKVGDGIKAWVCLSEQYMAVFEYDLELLAFASLDPSPLEHDNQG